MEKKQQAEGATFIVDDLVLGKIIEGVQVETSMKEMLDKITDVNPKCKAITTMASVLRAVHKSGESADMGRLKNILKTVKVYPSAADYKDEVAVREEIIAYADALTQKRKGMEFKAVDGGLRMQGSGG